jgi:RimJ/RimL family protein N-acetyltransferase
MNLSAAVLTGRHVRLEPITPEQREPLRAVLNCDPAAWEIMSVNGCGEGFDSYWAEIEADMAARRRIAFAVVLAGEGRVVGTSSLMNIRPMHAGVEIGSTFLHPDVRSGPVNPESKLLLLSHAFDAGAVRVEFNVDMRNIRSQAAVEKLGATREGVLRKHKITWTGHVRDTAVFSITDDDWPGVRERLEWRLQEAFV